MRRRRAAGLDPHAGLLVPHVVGTGAMGPRPDDGAVIDASGRVQGTDRLSGVDASIVPNGPSVPCLTNQA